VGRQRIGASICRDDEISGPDGVHAAESVTFDGLTRKL
jgi:hypothetical protein